jgi:hypothetical protein
VPFTDHFLGATPATPDYEPLFDGDDTTVATFTGTSGSQHTTTWDIGAAQTVESIRIRWSFGTLFPGYGAAAGFAIDRGDSATGPWTEILEDADPHLTAGVTYPQDFEVTYELAAPATAQHWRFRATEVGNNDIFTVEGLEDTTSPSDPPVDPGPPSIPPQPAILEIWVHDESASRWGTATWATGPATGTEGVWSAAGWQDVTPQGVMAHVKWGAQRSERGILADQDAASWNISTYDPDRVLDPGNPDSPYAPQLVAGLPIRLAHRAIVVRTGIVTELSYSYRAPDYEGRILATDAIATMARAKVPDDSILGDTLLERVQDAIEAAGIAIGGIPLRPLRTGYPPMPVGTDLSPRIEGEVSVWEHVKEAARETLWVAAIDRHGGLRLRPWGVPTPRGLVISDPMLEDLTAYASEDGMYSVVRALDALGITTIERVAAPLPRYGRIVHERTYTTEDPEAYCDAVLADRAWPGIRWRPGSIRPRTAVEADALARVEVHDLVTLQVAGVVTVEGKVAGGEVWVRHRGGADGATWRWRFNVITDGSTAIGTTTLVSDGTGDVLLDDATGTDYLTPD